MKTNDTFYYITFNVTLMPKKQLLPPQYATTRRITVASPQPYNGDTRYYWSSIKENMTIMGIEHDHGCNIQEITFVKEQTIEGEETTTPPHTLVL